MSRPPSAADYAAMRAREERQRAYARQRRLERIATSLVAAKIRAGIAYDIAATVDAANQIIEAIEAAAQLAVRSE